MERAPPYHGPNQFECDACEQAEVGPLYNLYGGAFEVFQTLEFIVKERIEDCAPTLKALVRGRNAGKATPIRDSCTALKAEIGMITVGEIQYCGARIGEGVSSKWIFGETWEALVRRGAVKLCP